MTAGSADHRLLPGSASDRLDKRWLGIWVDLKACRSPGATFRPLDAETR